MSLMTSFLILSEFIYGHMKPIGHEKLSKEIKLDCGLVLVENRDEVSVQALNDVCTFSFSKFLEHNNLKKKADLETFSLSVIPRNYNYRNLLDKKYRFYEVSIDNWWSIYGYTSFTKRHIFISNNDFKATFGHEIYHALSYLYGIDVGEEAAYEFEKKYFRK